MTRLRALAFRYFPFAILLALWLLFFWRYFVPPPNRVTFPDGDFTLQFFVFRDIAYRALAQGHLPLWASCLTAGYPFQADPQSQLFYPPIWFSFATLKFWGWETFPLFALTLETIAHYLFASFFTYFFLCEELPLNSETPRALLTTRLAAVFGAIVFTYGGYLTSYPPLQTAVLETATWTPMILLCLRRLVVTPSLKRVAFASLVIAIAFFAGHPQTFFLIAYLAVAYFVYRARVVGYTWRLTLWYVGLTFGLAIALVMVQALPELEYLLNSTRTNLTFEQLAGGFRLQDLAQFLVTGLVSYWSPLYMGVVPFLLALLPITLIKTKHPNARIIGFWASVTFIGLLLGFGNNAIGYDLAYWLLPGARLFRGQERAAVLVAFALTTLASFGAKFFLSPVSRETRALLGAGARSLLHSLPLVFFLLAIAIILSGALTTNVYLQEIQPKLALAIIGLVFACLVFWVRLSYFNKFSGPLLIGLTVVELFTANIRTNAVPLFDPYPSAPLLQSILTDESPFFRVQDDARMQGHFGCGYGLAEWSSITPIRLATWSEFDRRAPEALRWKMLGIKYLITEKGGALTRENELPSAIKIAEGKAPLGEAKVYQLFEIPHRAWIVYETQIVGDADSVYKLLSAANFDPFKTVVLRQNVSGVNPVTLVANGQNNLEIIADYPGYLKLNVATDSPGWFIFNEAYYPGWQAKINGQALDMLEANGLLQAVALPAGNAAVEIYFLPTTLILGLVISLFAGILSAACIFNKSAAAQINFP